MKVFPSFKRAIADARNAVKERSSLVHPQRWQSVDVSNLPEAATHEVLNYSFSVPVHTFDLDVLRKDISPNLPWADDHFLERVGGRPLNPGEQWKNWPWGHSADKFRTQENIIGGGPGDGRGFDHTYMERMWPKRAGFRAETIPRAQQHGIRFPLGDAMDVVKHLALDPLSRQAYLPIWFPEDTGKVDVRVPCTLGYHFIMRAGFLHVVYYIRSCDLFRHFQDDIYLTVRLQLWMIQSLMLWEANHRDDVKGDTWSGVKPGLFTMHITSLHLFRNDYIQMFGGRGQGRNTI